MLQNEVIIMVELPDLSLLQIEKKKSECSAAIMIFHKEKTQYTTNMQKYMAVILYKNPFFV